MDIKTVSTVEAEGTASLAGVTNDITNDITNTTSTDSTKDITEKDVREKRLLRLEDLPDPVPNGFDRDGFKKIMRDMKQTMTVRELALSLDLSDSFVNKALNGFIESSPSKKTMQKLLCAPACNVIDRRELVSAAGYPAEEMDWDHIAWGSEEKKQTFSTAETIARYYGGNHFIACGRLMKALAEHGVKGDISSYIHREAGYFEIKDENSGQVYVGINIYNAEEGNECAVRSLVFSLALTYNRVASSKGIGDKVVIIMTNDEKIYDGCKDFSFDATPKATLAVLTDSFHGFWKETVLNGKSPISLLD